MYKYLINRKGGALVLVLLVMVVLSILGVTLLGIGVAETRQVAFQEQKMKAYYLARAGADAVAENLLVNLDRTLLDALELNPGIEIVSNSTPLGDGSFITKTKFQSGTIIIESIGTIPSTTFGSVSAKAKLSLYNMHDRAIVAVGNYDLSSLKELSGNVESTSGVVSGMPGPIGWNPPGEKFNVTGRNLPPVNTPTLTPYVDPIIASPAPHPFEIPNNTDVYIPGSYEYSKITVGNNGKLVIDTSGGNVKIVTDVLDVKGSIKITGPNQVYIFITSPYEESFIKTSNDSTNTADQLFLFLDSGVKLNVTTGTRDFYGYIYGPEAAINLGSGAVVQGSAIGELFTSSGNPTVKHIPLTRTPEGYEIYTSGSSRYRKGYWD